MTRCQSLTSIDVLDDEQRFSKAVQLVCCPGNTNQTVLSFMACDDRSTKWGEVHKELQLLGCYKPLGPDDLPPALSKGGSDCVVYKRLGIRVFQHHGMSPQLSLSLKKGSCRLCDDYQGIILLQIASKLLVSVILRRLFKTGERLTREEQVGFRSGRGCIDHIFTLRQMLEHRHTYQRPTIVVFLDIRAAFDSLDRTVLWDCLLKKGVPEEFINILKALYTNTSGRVRAYNHLSPLFHSGSGARQVAQPHHSSSTLSSMTFWKQP
ncbi:hypothetical protein MS3_00006704 [Schistosoma haematobium]|uniref:Reverse transcriptase domain-containing protein n=1 Tax=Schistosoma haematobium TaxID=6185 RepID=A0A922IRN1_SCHHA|nr:hypothetical protein MS3_00006704 [Schistosoma haematobium]KAH9585462.1 hypothetical protein MS3_00006704 [Schistosoma haematobium]